MASAPTKSPMPDEKGASTGEGTGNSIYSTLGTRGEKPGPGGSNFPKSSAVEGALATLIDAKPEVRSGLEWPSTSSDSTHN